MRAARSISILVLASVVAVVGCSDERVDLPSITATVTDSEFAVIARGELVASESLPISLPGGVRMRFNVAWLAPEFSDVKAGDVIARFDDVQVQLDRDATALEVQKSDYKLANTERTGELEKTRIVHEASRVEGEKDISETFAEIDERLFSRNEIIDALADLDYLEVEAGFLAWQSSTYEQRTQAEENLILAEKQGQVSKLEKQEKALQMMELRSPADGTFIYARTPWGEKVAKGKTIWPGQPVGQLPIRGKVKARIFVPESDAVGLEGGQAGVLRLDAAPAREFHATVATVSPVASPRNREDPQKFFIVEATVDDVDADLMRVGSQLNARITTVSVDDAIVLPAQAVYGDADQAHVFVVEKGEAQRRVDLGGRRSIKKVEITEGLEAGERVSLTAPAGRS
jgi:multidrug efflux pump subunit AcrA (membrane-fusion protein)